jgi:hypothetical protein
MVLDPSFDFVILVGREVVGMTKDDIAERLILAHDEEVVQMQSDDGGLGEQKASALK